MEDGGKFSWRKVLMEENSMEESSHGGKFLWTKDGGKFFEDSSWREIPWREVHGTVFWQSGAIFRLFWFPFFVATH